MALDAYEPAIYKRYDVSVLVACDGDFLPLVRKLNTIGTRVKILGWDFKYVDRDSQDRETRTAQVLLDEVTYPIMVHQVIDDRSRRNDRLVNGLFVPHKDFRQEGTVLAVGPTHPGNSFDGKIHTLKGGYGFIAPVAVGPDLTFTTRTFQTRTSTTLKPSDRVRYRIGKNDRGPCAANVEVAAA